MRELKFEVGRPNFNKKSQGVVTYVCNPSYNRGLPFRQAWAKKVRPYLKHN
jgi:hypothetical protein